MLCDTLYDCGHMPLRCSRNKRNKKEKKKKNQIKENKLKEN